jgi:beta-lactam-binding protein with PASTA domain
MTQTDEWPTRDRETVVKTSPPQAPPPGTPPPYPPEEPDSPLGRGMLLALAVIALAVAGALAGWLVTHRSGNGRTTTVLATTRAQNGVAGAAVQEVAVPQLVGLTRQAAVVQLGHAGLRPKVQIRTTGAKDGLVVEQRPVQAKKVALGSTVLVLLDRESAPAQQTTSAQTTTHTTATTPAPPQASVPDVTRKPEADAVAALSRAGLRASIVFVPSSDDLGTVEAQSKPAGTRLAGKSHVQLNLSGGNGKFPPETVPNVIGKPTSDAVVALNVAQLRLLYERVPVTTAASDGKVVEQSPLAGDKAPQHAQVVVYVGALQH